MYVVYSYSYSYSYSYFYYYLLDSTSTPEESFFSDERR